MKKRLNIFCLLIILILSAEVGYMCGIFCRGVVDGFNEGMNAPAGTELSTGETVSLSVLPLGSSPENAFKATDKETGKTYEVWPATFMMKKNFETSTSVTVINILTSLIIFAASIIALVAFIKFIIGVNHNQVFTLKSVKRLRLMGWMFLAACAAKFISSLIDTQIIANHFLPHGYVLNYADIVPFDALIFAIFTFIIAEAFTIGIKLKEDQDLTI